MSRVALNSVAGMAANGIYLVSRLAITPFILIYVPLDQYGLWSVCFIIISYAGLSGFGVNNAYIKYSAQYYSRGEMAKLNGLVNTGLALMIGLCGLIFISLYMSVPYFIGKFGVSPELSKLSTMLIIGSAAAFLLDMGLGAFKAVLEGIQEIALVRLIWLASTLVEVVLIVVLLISGIGVLSLLYALAVRYMLAVACYTVLALKKIPGLAIGLRHINRNASRVLFSFGAKVQLLGVIGIFMTSFDRIVTTAFIGLEATGRFEIGRKFPSLGASVSAAAFDAFLPAASSSGSWLEKEREPTVRERLVKYGGLLLCSVLISLIPVAGYLLCLGVKNGFTPGAPLYLLFCILVLLCIPGLRLGIWLKQLLAEKEYVIGSEVKDLYLNGSRFLNLINGVLLIFLIGVGDYLIFGWVGQGYSSSVRVMEIMALSVLVNLATGPGTSLVKGMNRTGREFEYALVNLVLAIIWVPSGAYFYGMVGAALGTALSTIAASVYFVVRTNRAFMVPMKYYLDKAIKPLVAPLFAGVIVRLFLSFVPLQSRQLVLAALVGAGVFYLALTLLILKRVIFTSEEMAWVMGPIGTLLRKLKITGSAGFDNH